MLRVVLSPPNAILFVLDPENKDVVIPPYVDRRLTAATSTCISVGTQAEVDGDTEISLEILGAAPVDLHRAHFGTIGTPSGRVAVVTAQFQRLLELNVPVGAVEVSIWADDLRNPGRVAVGVKPATSP
jgi:hypothetical protein